MTTSSYLPYWAVWEEGPRAQTLGLDLGHSNPVGALPSLASVSSSVERRLERQRPRGRRPGSLGSDPISQGEKLSWKGIPPLPRKATAHPS